MSKLSQRIELTSNVLIIIVALLVVGVVVQRYFFTKSGADQQARVRSF